MEQNQNTEQLDAPTPTAVRDLWMRRIQDEEKKHSKFRDLAKASDEAYHRERTYNAWYPSVRIPQAALYSDTPDP
ncbi:MAG: hypothetical protein GY813_03635, partial [Halieaceae bacterium]|nr:hypothetical protein [Halieaceae bacterium]